MVRKCDILVAMTQSTLDSNIKDLKEDAVLLVDEDLVKQVPETKAKVYKLPITRVAQTELKSEMYANVIMLGTLTKITKIVRREAIEKAITASVNPDTAKTNLAAFKKGLDL